MLSLDELMTVCRQAAALGINRFKITGGEPLMREDCTELIRRLRQMTGTEQVTMTTNGVLLAENLDALLAAGLDAVNISLDTLDREQYRAITGRDELERVLQAVRLAAGKLPVKINCVVQRGVNEDAPVRLAALARDLPLDVRFIERMPIGAGENRESAANTEVLKKLEEVYGPAGPDEAEHGNGPAFYRRPEGFAGSIGFISAVHGKFCEGCNRLRLTATGDLKPCLCYADVIPLREILRDNGPCREERIREKIRQAVMAKPQMHCFEKSEQITEKKRMVQIGG